MTVLVVGAGAAGGYLGAQLIRAGREVRFLAHQHTCDRLNTQGLRIRRNAGVSAQPVRAVTAATLEGSFDVIVLAVRSDVVESAINDIRGVVGADTRIVPLVNGVAHLSLLSAAFGEEVVLGGAARLATSMLADGTIDEVAPGIDLELGQLDGKTSALFDAVVQQFRVDDVTVRVRADMVEAMWEKFTFITATAVLTCLAGDVIGVVARTAGGPALGRRIADEVSNVAAAEGYRPQRCCARSTRRRAHRSDRRLCAVDVPRFDRTSPRRGQRAHRAGQPGAASSHRHPHVGRRTRRHRRFYGSSVPVIATDRAGAVSH